MPTQSFRAQAAGMSSGIRTTPDFQRKKQPLLRNSQHPIAHEMELRYRWGAHIGRSGWARLHRDFCVPACHTRTARDTPLCRNSESWVPHSCNELVPRVARRPLLIFSADLHLRSTWGFDVNRIHLSRENTVSLNRDTSGYQRSLQNIFVAWQNTMFSTVK